MRWERLSQREYRDMDNNKKGNYNPEGTGGAYGPAVTFAVINLALVGLCFVIKLTIITSGTILFFLLGFYAVYLAIKDGITEKNMKGLGMGILGLLINIVAIVLYLMILKSRFSGS